ASVVFLAIAAVVGLVVGNAAAERRRATEREREARLLAMLSSKLLTGDVPDRVLDEFVALLLDPFNLAMCSVQVVLDGHEMSAVARRDGVELGGPTDRAHLVDRKSTRLNSSHVAISYAVFCLKKKKHNTNRHHIQLHQTT